MEGLDPTPRCLCSTIAAPWRTAKVAQEHARSKVTQSNKGRARVSGYAFHLGKEGRDEGVAKTLRQKKLSVGFAGPGDERKHHRPP